MNWFLAVSCIALVLMFRESARLAAAFGLAVSATMVATSLAFYTVARIHFQWPALWAGALVAFFLVVDLAFLGANMLKFLDGGYIPALVGAGFVAVMVVWARGKGLSNEFLRRQSESAERLLETFDQRIDRRLPGVGVVMTRQPESIPPVLLRVMKRFRALHETVLITTVVTEEVPYVWDDRMELEDIGRGLKHMRLRFGFMEEPLVHAAIARMLDRVKSGARPEDVTYVLGHERFVAGPGGRMGRVEEGFFALLTRNAQNPSEYFGLPPAQVVEVGARVDL
jgi:KUP system potassium uptake protein